MIYSFDRTHRICKIGLLNRCYDFMIGHLRRNIGNADFKYDGYSTPISWVSDPYYNLYKTPWFGEDSDKKRYFNYIEYAKNVYGYGLYSDDYKVGYVDSNVITNLLSDASNTVIITNPNGKNDTRTGKLGNFLLKGTLDKSIEYNDKRKSKGFYITKAVAELFGANTDGVVKNNIFSISNRLDKETGRYGNLSPLEENKSPLYNSNYLNYNSLGSYEEYYKSLGDKYKGYVDNILSNNDFNPLSGKNYIDDIGIIVGNDTIGSNPMRYVFNTSELHSTFSNGNRIESYAENEAGSSPNISGSFNDGIKYGYVSSFELSDTSKNDLINKTNKNFKDDKYKTLIARFHTKATDSFEGDITSSAISKKYGMSKGRNLLKRNPDSSEGYGNPYCRVWTYHHQYKSLADAIRPLSEDGKIITNEELENKYGFKNFRSTDSGVGGTGGKRLDTYGVKNTENGMVNITPNDVVKDIKKCMFSIENLAWKGMFSNALSDEQKGPFGGRIMWFPPYDLKFNESVNVDWKNNTFIGRGEDIYTYGNTSREGSLSFKLLIDHPSVLDFWNGKDYNEEPSEVDDIDSSEQSLLRFFAGCDMLTAKDAPEKTEEVVPEDKENSATTDVLTFFVFFPNDYSGKFDNSQEPSEPICYLLDGVGPMIDRNRRKILSYDMHKWYADPNKNLRVGGYEVQGNGIGVSVVDYNTAYTVGESDFLVAVWHEGSHENLNPPLDGEGGGRRLNIFRQGSTDKKVGKWTYRVDKDNENEILDKEEIDSSGHKYNSTIDYYDTTSYRLNAGGQRDKICEVYGIKDKGKLYSLFDVYIALNEYYEDAFTGYYDEERVLAFRDIVMNHKFSKIVCQGFADSHGITRNKDRNSKLIKNRANTVKLWLQDEKLVECDKYLFKEGAVGGSEGDRGNVSSLENKMYRCVRVDMYVDTDEVNEDKDTIKEVVRGANVGGDSETGDTGVTSVGVTGGTRQVIVDEKSQAQTIGESSERSGGMYLGPVVDDEDEKDTYYNSMPQIKRLDIVAPDEFNDSIRYLDDMTGETIAGDDVIRENTDIDEKKDEIDDFQYSFSSSNHDNEAEFFKLLPLKAPFLHHKITDKIKYFDPAFHSITPEGFNARLTFLHQCTRQGPTVGRSDLTPKTAGNLSFGRPPVCILRIGDFYYTKVIIKNVSINYDPIHWDLNTEGIGVMPMVADVQIGFTFIGGSDLAGPIARLQNAVSFNYYANTGVYDNRSEEVLYNDNGQIDKIKLFP